MGRYFQTLAVICLFTGCAGTRQAWQPPPDRPWENLSKACEVDNEAKSVRCDLEAFWFAGRGCIAIAKERDILKEQARATEAITNLDKLKLQAELFDTKVERDRYKSQRLWWFLSGTGAGAMLTTLLVLGLSAI